MSEHPEQLDRNISVDSGQMCHTYDKSYILDTFCCRPNVFICARSGCSDNWELSLLLLLFCRGGGGLGGWGEVSSGCPIITHERRSFWGTFVPPTEANPTHPTQRERRDRYYIRDKLSGQAACLNCSHCNSNGCCLTYTHSKSTHVCTLGEIEKRRRGRKRNILLKSHSHASPGLSEEEYIRGKNMRLEGI